MVTNVKIYPVISKKYLDRISNWYLSMTPSITPLASPLYSNLSGLPPMLIQVGSAEKMLDDNKRFVKEQKKQ